MRSKHEREDGDGMYRRAGHFSSAAREEAMDEGCVGEGEGNASSMWYCIA